MTLRCKLKLVVHVVMFFFIATSVQAATKTCMVRDTGFLRKGSVTSVLTKQQVVNVGYINGGLGAFYVGYLDFICDPPLLQSAPGANILSVTLKLNLAIPNPQILNAQYQVVNLESLLNLSAPGSVVDIDANNSANEIYAAFESGGTLGTFSNFSQIPGTSVQIALNKDLMDFSGNTKNYYIGLREQGDNDGLIVFNGINESPLAELVISYENTSKKGFPWPAFLPGLMSSGCSESNLDGCGTRGECLAVGGFWIDGRCTSCPFEGNYSGSWSENSCDFLPYSGTWTGTVDNKCLFIGIDEADDDFLRGNINPETGKSTSLYGVSEDCGPLTGTANFTATGVQGTYSGFGVSGNYTGTKQ